MASTFIRATEVWVPTADGSSIDLAEGLYGEELTHFRAVSRGSRNAFGEGLAGKTWERGQPIILKNLSAPLFNRRDAAAHDGLTCAVSLPIFAGNALKAMVLFLCNDDLHRDGAIELWCAPEGEREITLIDGYFGAARHFEAVTRDAAFARGVGLAGSVWDTGLPVLMPELSSSRRFARQQAAADVGFHRAVGWPCAVRSSGAWVMAFLSAPQSPIACRFENWLPTAAGNGFVFGDGFCESGADLRARWDAPITVPAFGEVRDTLVPVVTANLPDRLGILGRAALDADLTAAIVLPILSGGRFKSILTWYF